MPLPKDPLLLLSYINTKLRDDYTDLTDLCLSLSVDETALRAVLKRAGFEYNPKLNQFR